jgi:flagellar biosynthesis/type III secretory pathway protein FliH
LAEILNPAQALICLDLYRHYVERLQKRLNKKLVICAKKQLRHGHAAGRAQMNDFLKQFLPDLEKAHDYKIDLIMESAKEMVARRLQEDQMLIVGKVVRVLQSVSEHTDVEIICHPTHAEVLSSHSREIMNNCSSLRKISLAKDASMSLGSILIKANKSVIDALISTELLEARAVLKKQLSTVTE